MKAHAPRRWRLSTAHTPPDGPALLSALVRVTDTSATLAWQAGSANEASVVGYELFRDGKGDGSTRGRSATVALASAHEYEFVVRALDSDGYLSAPSPSPEGGDHAHAAACAGRTGREPGLELVRRC